MKKNYRLYRRVDQSLFVCIADVSKRYMHSLEPGEIKQLDEYNSKRKRGEVGGRENQLSIYKILLNFYVFLNFLSILMVLYHWPIDFYQCLMEKHLEVPKKTQLKRLYELIKDKKSHALVSLQFFSALNLIFGGRIEN